MAWDAKKLCKKLIDLCQLDIDAVRAYTQAIKNIDVSSIREQLERFKEDHERHIMDLSSHIRRLGEEAPKDTPDIKGFFIEGFTAIRSLTGTEGALKAMRGNENLTNKTYREALGWELPDEIRALVEKNFEDEVRHLAYIERTLAAKEYKSTEARPEA